MISTEWFIARRYLFSSRKEGFISVIAWFSFLGISLGIATLIIVMSVMNGFREELLTRLIGMRGHITVHHTSNRVDRYEDTLSLIKKIPGVVQAFPVIERQGVIMFQNIAHGVIIRGLRKEDVMERTLIMKKLTPPTLEYFQDDSVLMGRRLASRLMTKIGDTTMLIIPEMNITAFGAFPRQKRLSIQGFFDVGMSEYDKTLLIVPLHTAQKMFKLGNTIHFFEIFCHNPDAVEGLVYDLEKTLGPDFHVLDWQHGDSNIFHAVKVERNVMFLILTMIIIVASFNIISGLIILVKDKIKSIAILRTVGMSRGSILRIFLMIGSAIGVGGTLVGLTLGLSFALNIENIRQFLQKLLKVELFEAEIYFLSQLPSKVDLSEVLWIGGIGLMLSFLSTIYPAWRAARLDPAEGVR